MAVYYYTFGGISTRPTEELNLTARKLGQTTLYRTGSGKGACAAAGGGAAAHGVTDAEG
jgi:hypothetical protein